MKQLFILFGSLTLLNCSTQSQKEESSSPEDIVNEKSGKQTELVEEVVPESKSEQIDSSFNTFLIEFSSNKEFQLSRVDFPFNIQLIDIEDNEETRVVTKEEWQHSNLLDTAGIQTREYSKYSQTAEIQDTVATIKLRGIDNGIRVDYTFKLRKGRWYLTRIFNSSI
jgi:hypothetical protein